MTCAFLNVPKNGYDNVDIFHLMYIYEHQNALLFPTKNKCENLKEPKEAK
jgi:hypothetical protein